VFLLYFRGFWDGGGGQQPPFLGSNMIFQGLNSQKSRFWVFGIKNHHFWGFKHQKSTAWGFGFFCILEVLGMVWGGQQPPFLGFKHDF